MSKEQLIQYDFSNCLTDKIGTEFGLALTDINRQKVKFKEALEKFEWWQISGDYGFFGLPTKTEYMREVNNIFKTLPSGVDTFLHLGIGGSSLGPIAIQQALDNSLTKKIPTPFKKVIIQENVDPEGFAVRLAQVDWSKTMVNVVSKSGGTIETLASLTAILNRMSKQLSREQIAKRLIVSTENEKGILSKIGRSTGAKILKLPHNVGGRFSILTQVGLLPARAMGIDIKELLAGAEAMRAKCFSAKSPGDPCFLSAFIPYYYYKKGMTIHVLFPYSELLNGFALWCRQLLAESLGKKVDRNQEVVNTGSTPVASIGSVDQHSLLQLYMEGPNDKFYTFFQIEQFRSDEQLRNLPHPELDKSHKKNLTMGTLINAELKGTITALTDVQRPTVTVKIPELNAHTFGQLVYFFELSTAFSAELFNIDAFNQPGVEMSKKRTLEYLRGES